MKVYQAKPVKETERQFQGGILVGVDFSKAGSQALARARRLAREYDVHLYVLHVIEGREVEEIARLAEIPEKRLRERLERERRGRLEQVLSEAAAEDDERIDLIVAWGRPFEQILKKAMDIGSGLIVLGTAGHAADLERALFGSTAEKVLRAAPCPILCVPAE